MGILILPFERRLTLLIEAIRGNMFHIIDKPLSRLIGWSMLQSEISKLERMLNGEDGDKYQTILFWMNARHSR